MANAVTDLALLNSGQVILAEFWPGHESHFLDNDLHRPWWERVPDPGSGLTEEELWEQQMELWEHLSVEAEEELELDYLMETLGLHGGMRSFYEDSEPPLVHFHRPPPADVVVNHRWTAYVTPEKGDLPELPSSEHESSALNLQFSAKAPILRRPKRQEVRKHERYYDSHGWRGRTRLKYAPTTVHGA
jgi:hypothetical protein